jgi:D-alanyl-D-alanine carboxypeptidase
MANPTIDRRIPCPSVLNRRNLLGGSALALTAASGLAGPFPAGAFQDTPTSANVDAILQAGLNQGMPGIALAIERNGISLFSGAAGVARIEQGTPLLATDRFRIYSIAKTFTATVVLQLVDEGVLALDDTVTAWLDYPAVNRIPYVDRATVRQLLRHTSGIYDFADDTDSPFWEDAFLGPNADWTKVWTLPDLLAYADADSHAPYFAPGEGLHYSNTVYLLLGMIVEAVTGHAFEEELRARILNPLGLADTFLATGSEMPEGVVDGYQVLGDELANVSMSNLSWIWTAGGMVSTTGDLMRFSRSVLAGDLLSSASHEELFTFAATDNPNKGEGMGLYRITSTNGTMAGMDGSSAGFIAYMMWLVDEDITVVVLTNRAPDDGSTEAVLSAAFAWALEQE